MKKLQSKALELPEAKQESELRRLKDSYLDKGHGACWLKKRPIAEIVEQAILSTDGGECLVLAWSIMPNHVHVVVEIADDVGLSELLRKWKGPTARAANLALERAGSFWYPEYWDRFVRDQTHLRNEILYVDGNPVKAGLCAVPEAWPFGSARLSRGAG